MTLAPLPNRYLTFGFLSPGFLFVWRQELCRTAAANAKRLNPGKLSFPSRPIPRLPAPGLPGGTTTSVRRMLLLLPTARDHPARARLKTGSMGKMHCRASASPRGTAEVPIRCHQKDMTPLLLFPDVWISTSLFSNGYQYIHTLAYLSSVLLPFLPSKHKGDPIQAPAPHHCHVYYKPTGGRAFAGRYHSHASGLRRESFTYSREGRKVLTCPTQLNCLQLAEPSTTCSLTDGACRCSDAVYNGVVGQCVARDCTIPQALTARNLTSTGLCGVEPYVDHSAKALFITFTALAVVFVGLRFLARRARTVKVWWDDFCALLSLVWTPFPSISCFGGPSLIVGRLLLSPCLS